VHAADRHGLSEHRGQPHFGRTADGIWIERGADDNERSHREQEERPDDETAPHGCYSNT
jgi:hypothetical protein